MNPDQAFFKPDSLDEKKACQPAPLTECINHDRQSHVQPRDGIGCGREAGLNPRNQSVYKVGE
jgi:hypothetical protein